MLQKHFVMFALKGQQPVDCVEMSDAGYDLITCFRAESPAVRDIFLVISAGHCERSAAILFFVWTVSSVKNMIAALRSQ